MWWRYSLTNNYKSGNYHEFLCVVNALKSRKRFCMLTQRGLASLRFTMQNCVYVHGCGICIYLHSNSTAAKRQGMSPDNLENLDLFTCEHLLTCAMLCVLLCPSAGEAAVEELCPSSVSFPGLLCSSLSVSLWGQRDKNKTSLKLNIYFPHIKSKTAQVEI